ncbi:MULTISPECIES: hypothetical protein [unclassified Methanoculleus]|uniref:hypothetical protein n=1 Tax=unclassified Methanoculleus TaxID=2619537 RepID=UPI0025D0573E|nr:MULTISPECIES: hypothetical protein [unclassified Methanoculleus]
MPTCNDCALYTKKTETEGECSINGPVPADRDAGRCPSRTFGHADDVVRFRDPARSSGMPASTGSGCFSCGLNAAAMRCTVEITVPVHTGDCRFNRPGGMQGIRRIANVVIANNQC